MMEALVGASERGYGMTLLVALVAGTCAAVVAVVFVMAWREEDLVVAVMLGAVFLALSLVALVFLRASP
jgi:ABC-type sulfate transport system permease component